jgi:hypothetical protein
MNLLVVLIILICLFGIGGGPWWGDHSFGYGPYGGILGFLVLLFVLKLLGVF